MPAAPNDRIVRKRLVFFIPGFDPMPSRAHRERYRREAARQAALSGHRIDVRASREATRPGWCVHARIEGGDVETRVEVLPWADIVRASMANGVSATYAQLFRTVRLYLGSGAFLRLARLRKGPVIVALYPVVVLVLQLFLALALASGLAIAFAGAVQALAGPSRGPMVFALGLVPGGAAAVGLLRWFRGRDHWHAWYLVHDYAFSAQHGGAYPPEQEARIAAFARRIGEATDADVDEVLVVGHSSGAIMAVSVVADLLRAKDSGRGRRALSLLTLGQVIPMVSFLPRATRLRADLAELSVASDLAWVDVSAPGDGCAFALCDPVAVSGVAPEGRCWPLVLSAAFSRTLSAAARARLRWRFFERHFQYMNAFDALPDDPGAYDYFAVTAGPRTLGARFGARAPSASRVERPLSPFTDLAA